MSETTVTSDVPSSGPVSRGASMALVVVCGLFLLLFAALYFILPDESFSELENSALQTRPQISLASLNDVSFSEDLEDFYADQLPLRYAWLSLKAGTELALGRQENNGVFLCRNDYQIKRLEYSDLSDLKSNLEAADAILRKSEEAGVPAVLAVAPRAEDILTGYLPEWYDTSYMEEPWELVDDSGIPFIDLKNALRSGGDPASLWYRTDHHWSTDGAYAAYLEIAPALGVIPAAEDCFEKTTVSESFTGTTYGSSGMYWLPAESLVLYRYEGDERFAVTMDGTEQSGFYNWEALHQRNAYEVFFGGNYARVSVRDPDQNRPTLLVIKDSFANSVLPFLAIDFDLEIVDPRYYRGSMETLLSECAPCGVLILTGIDSLSTMPLLTRLP